MPVWRVSLWRVSNLCAYVGPEVLPFSLLRSSAHIYFAHFPFCVVLSGLHHSELVYRICFFGGWSIIVLIFYVRTCDHVGCANVCLELFSYMKIKENYIFELFVS